MMFFKIKIYHKFKNSLGTESLGLKISGWESRSEILGLIRSLGNKNWVLGPYYLHIGVLRYILIHHHSSTKSCPYCIPTQITVWNDSFTTYEVALVQLHSCYMARRLKENYFLYFIHDNFTFEHDSKQTFAFLMMPASRVQIKNSSVQYVTGVLITEATR